jgi:tRNA pseudouridine55 synthase
MNAPRMMGVINVHKPTGMTSRDVVNRVLAVVKPNKAGHAGTLDPLATGVLVVGVGAATRLMPRIQELRKVYRGTFQFGVRSNTDDIDGQLVTVPNARSVNLSDVRGLLGKFVGDIQQVPPAFSAVHVNGQRAYKLVRKGIDVQIPARTVTVHRIELLSLSGNQLELEIECGSGTYVRSIGRDLGNELKCGAVMSGLVRTRIGNFDLDSAVRLQQIRLDQIEDIMQPAVSVVRNLPQYDCIETDIDYLRNGRPMISRVKFADGEEVAMVSGGEVVAVANYELADNHLWPKKVFIRVDGS